MGSIFEDFKNVFKKSNNYLNQLIVVNLVAWVVYVIVFVTSAQIQNNWLFLILRDSFAIPSSFSHFIFKPWTLVTYSFLHNPSDIWHIIMNLLIFYWFGRIIQDLIGSSKILSIYVWGAVAGAITYLLAYNLIPFYSTQGLGIMVGASAAVNAIVVATATLTPTYHFNLVFLGRVKITYIAAFFVVSSYIGSVGANAGGNLAHLGGALMGYIFIRQLQKGIDLGKPIFTIIGFFNNLFKPSPTMKVSHRKRSNKGSSQSESVPQVEIDTILDKISQSGYESLTKEEKNKLFSASQKKD